MLRLIPAALYNVGWPGQAAAIIVDNDHPRPPSLRLDDGLFHLCTPDTDGFSYRLEASTDLLNWEPVCYNVVTDGALHFVDPDGPEMPARFYRVMPEVELPEED